MGAEREGGGTDDTIGWRQGQQHAPKDASLAEENEKCVAGLRKQLQGLDIELEKWVQRARATPHERNTELQEFQKHISALRDRRQKIENAIRECVGKQTEIEKESMLGEKDGETKEQPQQEENIAGLRKQLQDLNIELEKWVQQARATPHERQKQRQGFQKLISALRNRQQQLKQAITKCVEKLKGEKKESKLGEQIDNMVGRNSLQDDGLSRSVTGAMAVDDAAGHGDRELQQTGNDDIVTLQQEQQQLFKEASLAEEGEASEQEEENDNFAGKPFQDEQGPSLPRAMAVVVHDAAGLGNKELEGSGSDDPVTWQQEQQQPLEEASLDEEGEKSQEEEPQDFPTVLESDVQCVRARLPEVLDEAEKQKLEMYISYVQSLQRTIQDLLTRTAGESKENGRQGPDKQLLEAHMSMARDVQRMMKDALQRAVELSRELSEKEKEQDQDEQESSVDLRSGLDRSRDGTKFTPNDDKGQRKETSAPNARQTAPRWKTSTHNDGTSEKDWKALDNVTEPKTQKRDQKQTRFQRLIRSMGVLFTWSWILPNTSAFDPVFTSIDDKRQRKKISASNARQTAPRWKTSTHNDGASEKAWKALDNMTTPKKQKWSQKKKSFYTLIRSMGLLFAWSWLLPNASAFDPVKMELEIGNPCWIYEREDPVFVCTVHSVEFFIYWRRDWDLIVYNGHALEDGLSVILTKQNGAVREQKLRVSYNITDQLVEDKTKFLCENQGYQSDRVSLEIPDCKQCASCESATPKKVSITMEDTSTETALLYDENTVPKSKAAEGTTVYLICALLPTAILILAISLLFWIRRRHKKNSMFTRCMSGFGDKDIKQPREMETMIPTGSSQTPETVRQQAD